MNGVYATGGPPTRAANRRGGPRRGRGRGRGRGQAAERPEVQAGPAQEGADLANLIATLQQQLEAHNAEIVGLRQEMQRQPPPAKENVHVPQVNNDGEGVQVPPAVVVRPRGDLFERFQRMNATEFEGSSNPLIADEWMSNLKGKFEFMDVTEQEKVLCASSLLKKDARYWWETVRLRRNVEALTWENFETEFNSKYFDQRAMGPQQAEFNNIRQGNLSVAEAVQKFDRLARLCPHLVPTEGERVRRMLDMFRPELAVLIDSGGDPPETIADCVNRAIRSEYRLAQDKMDYKARQEDGSYARKKINDDTKFSHQSFQQQRYHQRNRNQNSYHNTNHHNNNHDQNNNQHDSQNPNHKRKRNFEADNNENNQNRPNQYIPFPDCQNCGKKHPGECKWGTVNCYACGKSEHYANECTMKNNGKHGLFKPQSQIAQLNYAQTSIDGLPITQGQLEMPEPRNRIYAYTRGDALASSSSVVTSDQDKQ